MGRRAESPPGLSLLGSLWGQSTPWVVSRDTRCFSISGLGEGHDCEALDGNEGSKGGHLNRGLSGDGDDRERWGARSRQKGRCWVCTDVGESDEVGL